MSSDDPQRPEGSAGERDRVRLINRVVGKRYEVLEFLSEGPILTAFRARDQQQNRIVTLKTLRSDLQSRVELIQSLREGFAETLSLSHPSIVRVFDVGIDEALIPLYEVEEFVRGIDLRERIRRAAPFQLTAATDIAIALTEALSYAHHRGISHGDLCPQNILISPEAQVKLTGFGVAATHALLAREDPAVLMRMAHYAAPDLAMGTLSTASADLYALCILLYEMLTGEPPFRGENPVQIALRHAQEAPPAPRTINQAVPRALEGVVLKGLAKRPQDRYQDADQLLEDLRSIHDALRFGRSLAWSPLDAPTTPPVPLAPEGGAESSSMQMMPTIVESKAQPGRRVSQPLAPKGEAKRSAAPSDPPPPRRTGGVLLAINLTLLLALIATGASLFNGIRPFLTPPNRVVIPELRGKTLTEAKAIASDRRFKLVVVDSIFMDDKPANTIYQQKDLPETLILEGKEVSVWVSKGPEMVVVPNVEEMTLDKAQKELDKIGLKVGVVTRRHDPLTPEGVVLEQLPRGDSVERRPRKSKIDLVLSKGSEPEPTPEPLVSPPDPGGGATPDPSSSVLPDAQDHKNRTFRVPYRTPKDGQQHHIVIQVEDSEGTHSGYDSNHGPDQAIRVEVSGTGRPITIKLYDNDDLKAQSTPVKGP